MSYEPFDYDSLIVGAYYQGTYVRDDPDNSPDHVGKFLGFSAEQRLKALQNPDSRHARQVPLLCNDYKDDRAWRFFDPESLVLVEPTDDQKVED